MFTVDELSNIQQCRSVVVSVRPGQCLWQCCVEQHVLHFNELVQANSLPQFHGSSCVASKLALG